MGDNICGVILAAGLGERIRPLSLHMPKPLLPVCNETVIEHQIREMKKIGIGKIFVVVKYLKHKIIDYLNDGKNLGVDISYVEQKETLGIAHAVGQLERHIHTPFLLILGDIFFVPRRMEKMLEIFKVKNASAVLGVKKETDYEAIKNNFAVVLQGHNRVKRVIEKPRYFDINLKGCGLYLFSLAIFDAVRMTPRTAMRDEYEITNSIQILIDEGCPVFAAEVIQRDTNITCPRDLLDCNLYQLQKMKRVRLIGERCRIHKDAKIINSVIGDRVTIKNGITIKDSLVYPDIKLTARHDIKGSIVMPNSIICCHK